MMALKRRKWRDYQRTEIEHLIFGVVVGVVIGWWIAGW